MSYDDDVIELGADGTFDIPSPPKNKDGRPVSVASKLDQVIDPPVMPPKISSSEELAEKIKAGDYRVYLNKSTKQHYIVLHLFSSDKPDVKAYKTYITVSDAESVLKIDISKLDVDVKSTHVQQWNDFLTIRFSK